MSDDPNTESETPPPSYDDFIKDEYPNGYPYQASTDGFLSICPSVHLRPHFQNSNGPSSDSVHEVDGPCSSTVHLCPFITDDH